MHKRVEFSIGWLRNNLLIVVIMMIIIISYAKIVALTLEYLLIAQMIDIVVFVISKVASTHSNALMTWDGRSNHCILKQQLDPQDFSS